MLAKVWEPQACTLYTERALNLVVCASVCVCVCVSMLRESACNAGDLGSIPGLQSVG